MTNPQGSGMLVWRIIRVAAVGWLAYFLVKAAIRDEWSIESIAAMVAYVLAAILRLDMIGTKRSGHS